MSKKEVPSARPFPSYAPQTQGGFSAALLCRLLGILPPKVRSRPADHMQASRILLPSSALPPYDY